DLLNRRRFVILASIFITLVVAGSLGLHAQTAGSFATISGTVVDPDGNVIENADVAVRNDLTRVVHSTKTSAEGRFSVMALPVGTYTIEVSAPGFTSARSSGLQLAANGLENISISLSIAKVTEEVTVAEFVPVAATLAPSQSSLDARSAQSVI